MLSLLLGQSGLGLLSGRFWKGSSLLESAVQLGWHFQKPKDSCYAHIPLSVILNGGGMKVGNPKCNWKPMEVDRLMKVVSGAPGQDPSPTESLTTTPLQLTPAGAFLGGTQSALPAYMWLFRALDHEAKSNTLIYQPRRSSPHLNNSTLDTRTIASLGASVCSTISRYPTHSALLPDRLCNRTDSAVCPTSLQTDTSALLSSSCNDSHLTSPHPAPRPRCRDPPAAPARPPPLRRHQ